MKIKIKKINPFVKLPRKGSEQAAAYDIFMPDRLYFERQGTYLPAKSFIRKNAIETIPLGFATEIPEGYYAAVHIRSSLGKKGIILSNCTGIIDADFRGEWKAMLTCVGPHTQIIAPGDRFAQIIIRKIETFEFEEVDDLSDTIRGVGGIGSTGR